MNLDLRNDGELLQQFIATQKQELFEALIHRHGSLVFGICTRLLGSSHDAEDASQAVFMTLAHKASTLIHMPSLAGWRHRVSFNVSMRIRLTERRRDQRENEVRTMNAQKNVDGFSQAEWQELSLVLDEALNELAEKYRVPFILYHIEGRTQADIATLMSCSARTISERLETARQLLLKYLQKKEVSLAPSVMFLMISKNASVEMPVNITTSTAKAAVLITAGNVAAPGLVSAQASALTQGVLKTMLTTKMKTAAAVFVLGVVSAGTLAAAATFQTLSVAPIKMERTNAAVNPVAEKTSQPSERIKIAQADLSAAPLTVPSKAGKNPQPVNGDKDAPNPVATDAPKPVVALTADEIAAYSRQLADADAAKRYEAYQKLRSAGEAARIALESAAKSTDANTSSVAKTLLGVLKTQPYLAKRTEKAKTVKSIEADLEGSGKMMGMTMTMSGKMKAKPEEKKFYEEKTMTIGGTKMSMTGKDVCDGTIYWQETTPPFGDKDVTSYSADFQMNETTRRGDSESPLWIPRNTFYDFTEVTEGTLADKAVYILTGVVKPGLLEERLRKAKDVKIEKITGSALLNTSLHLYVGKDDGLIYKFETLGKDNELMMAFSNIKVNGVIDEQCFAYCPPAGVKISDGEAFFKKLEGESATAAKPASSALPVIKNDIAVAVAKPAAPPTKTEISSAAQELSTPDATKRYEAANTLLRAGESARSTLEIAAKSKQADVASTAKTLLAALKTQPYLNKISEMTKSLKSAKAESKETSQLLKMGISIVLTSTIIANPSEHKVCQSSEQTASIGDIKTQSKTICNGTRLWTSYADNRFKETRAYVYPANYKMSGSERSMLELVNAPWNVRICDYIFTEVAEGTEAGKPVIVLTGTLKPGLLESGKKDSSQNEIMAALRAEIESVRLTLSKEDGLIRKLEAFNKANEVVHSTVFSQIKLGEAIDEKVFTYIAPEGVKIKDGAAEANKNQTENAKENLGPVAPPSAPDNF